MFKLDDYEDVATLNRWFLENYPMGRTTAHDVISHDPVKGLITIVAKVWRDANDEHPVVTNIANGDRDLMPSNMRRWYVEDTATSALGRALTLLKGGKTATKESMEQVMQATPLALDSDPWASVTITTTPEHDHLATGLTLLQGSLGGVIVDEAQQCSHGRMVWKEGISNKTGSPYKGWTCPSKVKPQCAAVWVND
jgi:hypothetical protein